LDRLKKEDEIRGKWLIFFKTKNWFDLS
jgi:hypothetical protein